MVVAMLQRTALIVVEATDVERVPVRGSARESRVGCRAILVKLTDEVYHASLGCRTPPAVVRRTVLSVNQSLAIAGRKDRAIGERGIDGFLRGRIVLLHVRPLRARQHPVGHVGVDLRLFFDIARLRAYGRSCKPQRARQAHTRHYSDQHSTHVLSPESLAQKLLMLGSVSTPNGHRKRRPKLRCLPPPP